CMAIAVVGFLIWFSGVITRATGNPTDLLGVGLTGEVGFLIYVGILVAIAAGIYLTYRAIIAGKLWASPIQRAILRVPMLGGAIRTLAIARFAWTLQLTLGAAIDVKRALSLALASTHNVEFTDHTAYIQEMTTRGQSIHETLAKTRVFPTELIQ